MDFKWLTLPISQPDLFLGGGSMGRFHLRQGFSSDGRFERSALQEAAEQVWTMFNAEGSTQKEEFREIMDIQSWIFSMVNKKWNYQFGYHLSYFAKMEEAFPRMGNMSRTIRPFDALLVRRPESACTTDIQADGKFDFQNLLCLWCL